MPMHDISDESIVPTITNTNTNSPSFLLEASPDFGVDNKHNGTYPADNSADPLPQNEPTLGTLSLAVLVFYTVSGGPFGIEPTVRAGGAMYSLLAFLLLPLFWSIPEALITTELGSAYPEASGGIAWIEEAFGTTAGFIAGYLSWISGATDNAIYPMLFMEYFLTFMTGSGTVSLAILPRFLLLSSISIVLAYVNYLGLKLVGNMSIIICIISMSPFILLCILGAPKVDPSRWFERPQADLSGMSYNDFEGDGINRSWFNPTLGGVLWRPFLNNLFWNLNSFDSAANFGGEVQNAERAFPRAMFLALLMVVCGYFFPLLVAIGANESVPQNDWVDGYLATVATNVVGPWLGGWTVLAAGISNLALFQSEMSADAFQIMGMADRGMIPKIFSKRSRHGTPTYGILLGTAVLVIMSVADFSNLVAMLNFNYAISLLMEFAAFVKLRHSKPDVPRPYRVPLSTPGCVLMLLPSICLTLFIMAISTFATYLYCAGGLVLCMTMFLCQTYQTKSNSGYMHVLGDVEIVAPQFHDKNSSNHSI